MDDRSLNSAWLQSICLLSRARVTVLGLSNGLVGQQYPHCDKGVAETTLIDDCWHIYAHGSWPDMVTIAMVFIVFLVCGARRGGRTRMTLRSRDFKSLAYTSFATRA